MDNPHLSHIQVLQWLVQGLGENYVWNFKSEYPTFVWLTWSASNSIWIACVVRKTCAVSPVISGRAVGKSCTLAGINTLFIFTFLSCWTVRIYQALIWPAPIIWIANVVGLTGANGPVDLHTAHGILSTLFIEARILAFSIKTGLSQRTFIIWSTSSCEKREFIKKCPNQMDGQGKSYVLCRL